LSAVVQTVLDVKAEPGPPADLVERLVAQAIAFKQDTALATVLAAIGHKVNGHYAAWQRAALRGLLDALARRSQTLAKWQAGASPEIAMGIDHLQPIFVDARRLCGDEHAELADRVTAVALLGRDLHDRESDMALLAELLAPQTPRQLQSAVIAALGGMAEARSPQLLLASWKTMGPELRGQVLDALLGRSAWSTALLDSVEHGEIAAAEIDAARAQRLLDSKDKVLSARAARLLGGNSNPDRQKVVAQYREATQLTGDAARGTEVFKKRCASCHKLGSVGFAIGPDLTALTDKSAASLLVAILDPNKAVETKFISYTAITAAGLTYTGLLAAETDSSVTLLAAEGKEIPLVRSELETLVSSSKSLMPEGLEKDLRPQDLADLFVLIAQSAMPRKTFARNRPEVVQPEALRGEFYLLPENAEIYGSTLLLEDRYDNLGFWRSDNDYAAWTMDVPKSGAFDVWLEYACADEAAGNEYTLYVGAIKKSERVSGTGSWDNYRQMSVGRLELEAGQQRVVVKPAGKLRGPLFDLKSLRLRPVIK
jgi:putative heme-binding domain-containing protein